MPGFGDGAMRQATPLSPVVHLGADRILGIGIRDETGDREAELPCEPPSFAQIAGYMLDTLFMDGLYSDLERVTRINELLDSVPELLIHFNKLANQRLSDTEFKMMQKHVLDDDFIEELDEGELSDDELVFI